MILCLQLFYFSLAVFFLKLIVFLTDSICLLLFSEKKKKQISVLIMVLWEAFSLLVSCIRVLLTGYSLLLQNQPTFFELQQAQGNCFSLLAVKNKPFCLLPSKKGFSSVFLRSMLLFFVLQNCLQNLLNHLLKYPIRLMNFRTCCLFQCIQYCHFL